MLSKAAALIRSPGSPLLIANAAVRVHTCAPCGVLQPVRPQASGERSCACPGRRLSQTSSPPVDPRHTTHLHQHQALYRADLGMQGARAAARQHRGTCGAGRHKGALRGPAGGAVGGTAAGAHKGLLLLPR